MRTRRETAIFLFLSSMMIGSSGAWSTALRLHQRGDTAPGCRGLRPPRPTTRLRSGPPGKVPEPDEWLRFVSESLRRFYGWSLYEELAVAGPEGVHANERHVVISHGNQTDPVYNYANRAGLLFFGYPEAEFVRLPSRYSAPDGALREDRSAIVRQVLEQGFAVIPEAIRQNKAREPFRVRRILYFNVYDDDGNRIGQAATFDREKVEALPRDASGSEP